MPFILAGKKHGGFCNRIGGTNAFEVIIKKGQLNIFYIPFARIAAELNISEVIPAFITSPLPMPPGAENEFVVVFSFMFDGLVQVYRAKAILGIKQSPD